MHAHFRLMIQGLKLGLGETRTTPTPDYEIQEFSNSPGIHFERFGRIHYAQGSWKIVVSLDLTTLTRRYEQLNIFFRQTQLMCNTSKDMSCLNIQEIIKREDKYLNDILTQIQIMHKPSINKRRGLIDGLGSVAKALFGVMDANDGPLTNNYNCLKTDNRRYDTLYRTS